MGSEQEATEGMSTTKKVVAGAAVGVAVPAAVGVAKKLMGDSSDDEDGDGGQSGAQGRSSGGQRRSSGGRSTTSRSRSSTSGSSSRARGSSSGSRAKSRSSSSRSGSSSSRSRSSGSSSRSSGSQSGGRQRTKEQLYATAKRLKIDGRSKMSKAQLERAVARARS